MSKNDSLFMTLKNATEEARHLQIKALDILDQLHNTLQGRNQAEVQHAIYHLCNIDNTVNKNAKFCQADTQIKDLKADMQKEFAKVITAVNQAKKSTSFDFRPQVKADSAATTTQATTTQAATTVQHATNPAKATLKQTTLGQNHGQQ
ncbi:hypothetical protein MMC24_007961 [Lignoscripta atroalba]|nr:hypothetical protein [Lignoscripta atroalba]